MGHLSCFPRWLSICFLTVFKPVKNIISRFWITDMGDKGKKVQHSKLYWTGPTFKTADDNRFDYCWFKVPTWKSQVSDDHMILSETDIKVYKLIDQYWQLFSPIILGVWTNKTEDNKTESKMKHPSDFGERCHQPKSASLAISTPNTCQLKQIHSSAHSKPGTHTAWIQHVTANNEFHNNLGAQGRAECCEEMS